MGMIDRLLTTDGAANAAALIIPNRACLILSHQYIFYKYIFRLTALFNISSLIVKLIKNRF